MVKGATACGEEAAVAAKGEGGVREARGLWRALLISGTGLVLDIVAKERERET